MEIVTELRSVLNDDQEPLPKRLKIAQNALNSVELIGINKEELILEWFTKISKSTDKEVWTSLKICLNSRNLENFRQSEINQEIITKLIKVVSKSLKECSESDVKSLVLECAKIILRNASFKQFFKHNGGVFINFLAAVLKNIDERDDVLSILNDRSIFDQKIFVKDECCRGFITKILPIVFDNVLKFQDENIESCAVKLIQKVVIQSNQKHFEAYFNNVFEKKPNDHDFVQFFMTEFSNFYSFDLQKAQISFKILTKTFFELNIKNEYLFKFFVIILNILDITNQFSDIPIPEINLETENKKSLVIFSEIFKIVTDFKIITPNLTVNDIKFDDFIKNLLKGMLESKTDKSSVIKIFQTTILLNPTIIDNLINDIIVSIILRKKSEEDLISYENFLVSVFKMYLKLHRVHKFTSEILRLYKNTLMDDSVKISKNVDEILPSKVLIYYENCVTQQSGKQLISLMRTFVIFLQEIVENLKDFSSSSRKKVYVEVLTKLFCHFLYVVRIAEYSTTQLTISKFAKDLSDMKNILGKFGTELLNIEHDQPLMHCFLTLSEAWGDLIILLKFYSKNPNGQELKNILPIDNLVDFPSNNMTYIHDFLSSKQWSVIAQRIKNFGEKPCQEILNKIIFQKIRGYVILNSNSDKNEIRKLLGEAFSGIDDNWYSVLTENPTIMSLFDDSLEDEIFVKIGNGILDNFLQTGQIERNILVNKNLVTSVLFLWFAKVNSLFKMKRKLNDQLKSSLTSKVYKHLEPAFVNFEELSHYFEEALSSGTDLKIDEEKLIKLLGLIKFVPVYALEESVQKMLFVFILAVRIDSRNNDKASGALEDYLKGIIESPWAPNFLTTITPSVLIQIFIKNIKNYKHLLMLLLNKGMKYNETIGALPKVDQLPQITPSQNLEVMSLILNSILKINKSKLNEDSRLILKEYKTEICNDMFKKIVAVKKIDGVHLESYVLLLNHYLTQNCDSGIEKLIKSYKKYVSYCLCETLGQERTEISLFLFEILLRHKTKFDLEPDFVKSTWNFCSKTTNFNTTTSKQLNKTVSLVFELNSVENFAETLNELLQLTIEPLRDENFIIFNDFMKIWHCLINSALSVAKQEIFFKALVKFFEHIIIFLVKNDTFDDVFVKLELDTINNKQITPSGNMIDIYLETVSILLSRNYDFTKKYNLALSIMSALIETRKYFIIDRLPSYLANVRSILNALCQQSHSESKETVFDKKILDCAFQFEKLIRRLCYLKKDMARIAPYLVGDILKNYEKTMFVHGVKNYLDNCIFLLLEICDQHAVSYLFRVLTPASTELFKNIYDNYQKYHRFSGRI